MKQRDPDPILILGIRFTKPLYWREKGGRDCGRLRRFSDSDTKYQLRINNQLCVAEALRNLEIALTLGTLLFELISLRVHLLVQLFVARNFLL